MPGHRILCAESDGRHGRAVVIMRPPNHGLHLTALSAPPGQPWRRRFVLADARTAPQLIWVFGRLGKEIAMRAIGLAILGFVISGPISADELSASACKASRPEIAQPAKDPNADPFPNGPWYINADRTIWAGWDAANLHEGSNKVLWIRPQGTDLEISGRRLDAESSGLAASIPCCYPTGFQATGLTFPTAGWWEVKAKAGSSTLVFVTLVKPRRRHGAAEQ